MGIPLEEEEDDDDEPSTEVMPSSQRRGIAPGLSRPAREGMIDRLLPFAGERGAAASAALTSSRSVIGTGVVIGTGGVINDEGDDEMTDDESHSIGGEDQGWLS